MNRILKITVFLLIAYISIATSFGQNETDIKQTFEAYFEAVSSKDNAATLDYIYPKLFDFYPKEMMLQALDRVKEDTTTHMAIDNSEVVNVTEPLVVDGVSYALVSYTFEMSIQIMADVEGDEEYNRADFAFEMLKELHGEDQVTYDQEHSKVEVKVSTALYAINDPKYNGWKFLEKKEGMQPMLEKLLPAKVLKKL